MAPAAAAAAGCWRILLKELSRHISIPSQQMKPQQLKHKAERHGDDQAVPSLPAVWPSPPRLFCAVDEELP